MEEKILKGEEAVKEFQRRIEQDREKEIQPFKIVPVDTENDKYMIVVGVYKATNKIFKTKEEAEKYISQKPWELIMSLTFVAAKAAYNYKEEEK